MERLSPTVVNRALLIDLALRQHGTRLFFYSPKHIKSMTQKVPGYIIRDNAFVRTESTVPLVNGNWTYSTRRLLNQGMGYRQFTEWADTNRVGIYVPLSFSELVAKKYEASKLVRAFRTDLHPHTELYHQSAKQLFFFLEQDGLVFLKPRAGNKGDGIVTVRRTRDAFVANFYKAGTQKKKIAKKLSEVFDFVTAATGGSRKYIIQEGIDCLRYEGSVFDLRVIMLYDGKIWSWLHEARYSPPNSDLSNVSQGGVSVYAEALLGDMLGAEQSKRVLDELQNEAFGLAHFLERLHPGELMEIAFDFVLDKDAKLRLVEVNSKPGLVSAGFDNNFFDMQPGQQPLFERWVYPHTNALASFLQSKLDAL